MSPEAGLAATRLALFLIIGAGLALLFTSRDSAEFVVLVLVIAIGLVMLGAVALLARFSGPRS
jgi:type IV secretory pathway VirB2 component (pilin)